MFRKKNTDPDNPPLTPEILSQMRPMREFHPDLVAYSQQKLGRPRKDMPKGRLSMRVDADVLAKIKALGPGYQTQINNWLREMVSGKAIPAASKRK